MPPALRRLILRLRSCSCNSRRLRLAFSVSAFLAGAGRVRAEQDASLADAALERREVGVAEEEAFDQVSDEASVMVDGCAERDGDCGCTCDLLQEVPRGEPADVPVASVASALIDGLGLDDEAMRLD